jgi:hypothetical protein
MRENFKFLGKGASAEILREGYALSNLGITSWLVNKNIVSVKEKVIGYSDITSWFRAGGETYICIFEFSTLRRTKRIVIKALVTLLPEKSLLDWERRRGILQENDIPVSNWYSASKGTIYEDFYPFSAKETTNFKLLLEIGKKLDYLGFNTLKFIDDIRADEAGKPYFIDFGFDLGEPSNKIVYSAKEYLIKSFPQKVLEINTFYDKNKSL